MDTPKRFPNVVMCPLAALKWTTTIKLFKCINWLVWIFSSVLNILFSIKAIVKHTYIASNQMFWEVHDMTMIRNVLGSSSARTFNKKWDSDWIKYLPSSRHHCTFYVSRWVVLLRPCAMTDFCRKISHSKKYKTCVDTL